MIDRRGPALARCVWALVLILSVGNAALHLVDAPRSWESDNGSVIVLGLGMASAGAVVATRLPRNVVGWIFLGVGFTVALGYASGQYAIRAVIVAPGTLPVGTVAAWLATWVNWALIPLLGVFLPLLFPSGRLPSRRWRLPAWVIAAMTVALLIIAAVPLPGSSSSVGSDGSLNGASLGDAPSNQLLGRVGGTLYLALILCTPIAVGSLVMRFRRSRGDERQQLKWLLGSGFALVVVIAVSLFTHNNRASHPVQDQVISVLFVLACLGLPAATGVAILRYRLYDIDVVINRALVYGTLAGFITGVYIAIVVGVGSLVGSGGRPNLGLSILATAVVAVAFHPVRERVQRVANRLVYGRRASPYEVLSRFSERVAETYSGQEVLPRMARLLAEGTGAERADVWLLRGGRLVSGAAFPASSARREPLPLTDNWLSSIPGTDRAVPVHHQGQLLGALTVTMHRGESLSPSEAKLLGDLARQAGLVLKNVGLTAELLQRLEELRASRKRLVAAQDGERRRLERNLHDGAQQHLVSLKIRLGLLDMLAGRDPARAMVTIAQLESDAEAALDTLRDLARGVYPPLLADKGLAAALRAQARRATLPVVVDADGIARFPQEIEAAVYFCCLEALQNVQKYAGAQSASIRLRDAEGEVSFTVEDDGLGFDSTLTPRGSGLQNMADRLDALGGRIDVDSAPGRGTRVHGRLRTTAAVGV